jgi:hypothetical protein
MSGVDRHPALCFGSRRLQMERFRGLMIATINRLDGLDPACLRRFQVKVRFDYWYSFLSGASEPVGALVGYALLQAFFTEAVFGVLFAAVGGIMVFIALDELLPTAREYGTGHLAIYGVVLGMAVMAVSLLLFL